MGSNVELFPAIFFKRSKKGITIFGTFSGREWTNFGDIKQKCEMWIPSTTHFLQSNLMHIDKIKSCPTSYLTNIPFRPEIHHVMQVKCALNAVFSINICL